MGAVKKEEKRMENRFEILTIVTHVHVGDSATFRNDGKLFLYGSTRNFSLALAKIFEPTSMTIKAEAMYLFADGWILAIDLVNETWLLQQDEFQHVQHEC